MNRASSSLVVDTKPGTGPGSRPAASAAASPVDWRPMTTHCPASSAALACPRRWGVEREQGRMGAARRRREGSAEPGGLTPVSCSKRREGQSCVRQVAGGLTSSTTVGTFRLTQSSLKKRWCAPQKGFHASRFPAPPPPPVLLPAAGGAPVSCMARSRPTRRFWREFRSGVFGGVRVSGPALPKAQGANPQFAPG